ncbi:MAG TPA: PilX N-terminal domain-containing pilus assembly protein [Sulfuricaulis sp.]|nr:PilX N-terminal domain-containing pilus assembly protein [Sulfuricaulis sp.]
MTIKHSHSFEPHSQQGVALVMSLVFLLLLTMLGVTALSTTSLEEKMAANSKERNTSFQAAESALVVAEAWINAQINKPIFPDNAKGLYLPNTCTSPTTKPVWDCPTLNWSSTTNLVVYPSTPTATVSGGLTKVGTQPKYIIEDLGETPEKGGSVVMGSTYKGKGNTVLRVTSRGTGSADAAQAMVQSVYSRAF